MKYRYLFDLKENSRPIHSNDKTNLDKSMTELKKSSRMCLEFSLIYKSTLHHVDHNKKRPFFNQSRHETDVLLFFFGETFSKAT